ncbi:hypothetical protein SAMN02745121_03562 [Nannocystis exedens]|uniref:Uncharacterized protein n=1 Tax=Nannocystis exedens TaxID=54 RepID=A0A1I1YVM3_9BACT|nr:hypothetical protein [Nannocystis exedens]PCC70117.1 hypothetical protein NAEX_03150 [Nannocystis exedens]SFE23362.1 hypothetical protein SAMN02745121_03562 [Nannocystis exedens]
MGMSIRARFAAVLFALAACDMVHQDSPPKLEESKHNASGDRGGLSACYDDCARQELDAGDEVSCRRNCEMAFKVAPTAADAAFDAAARCMHRCGDSRACAKRCKRRARAADEAVTDESLDRLSVCVDGCHADRKLGDGDRWTCVRNCAQSAKYGEPPPS